MDTITTTTHPNDTAARGRRGRITRGAAALLVAASAAFGSSALAADAGATTPLPDPFDPGSFVVSPITPTIPSSPRPGLSGVDIPYDVVIPEDLEPIRPIPDLPPAWTGDSEGGGPVDVPTGPVVTPDDLDPDGSLVEDGCLTLECVEDSDEGDPDEPEVTIPEGTIPPIHGPDCVTTPSSWGSEAGGLVVSDPCDPSTSSGDPEGLGYPDGEGFEYPESTPVRTETAEGVLAFTGSDALLPIAGAGLLGAGGVLAGISVLARRARNGRS